MPDADPAEVGTFTVVDDCCGRAAVRVTGQVDLANAGQLLDVLLHALHSRDGVVLLDLVGLDFMDSSGLHALMTAVERHPGRLRLGTSNPRVDRLLEVSGTRHHFA